MFAEYRERVVDGGLLDGWFAWHTRAMSFDSKLYTRDRPILDETQTSWLARDGAYTWEYEKWLFGGMIVDVEPYEFVAGDGDPLGEEFPEADEVPDWTREIRWVVCVSGSRPDDHFFNWFDTLATDARGVIWTPYDKHSLEHVDGFEPRYVAWRMLLATRPIHCGHNDRARDLVRRDAKPEKEPALDVPVDLAEIDAAWRAARAIVYGAALATAADAGVRVSWAAAQHLHLAADPDADGPLWFSMFDAPVRGRADAPAMLTLTAHPDPRIDALLRDPAGAAELRALASDTSDPLLRALAGLEPAEPAPLPDSRELRNELVEFWERVVMLDPRLDPAELDDVRRPRMG